MVEPRTSKASFDACAQTSRESFSLGSSTARRFHNLKSKRASLSIKGLKEQTFGDVPEDYSPRKALGRCSGKETERILPEVVEKSPVPKELL